MRSNHMALWMLAIPILFLVPVLVIAADEHAEGTAPDLMLIESTPAPLESPTSADPVGPDPESIVRAEREYVVHRGDTLAAIAQRELGSREKWRVLARANDIEDPLTLRIGQRLRIPRDLVDDSDHPM